MPIPSLSSNIHRQLFLHHYQCCIYLVWFIFPISWWCRITFTAKRDFILDERIPSVPHIRSMYCPYLTHKSLISICSWVFSLLLTSMLSDQCTCKGRRSRKEISSSAWREDDEGRYALGPWTIIIPTPPDRNPYKFFIFSFLSPRNEMKPFWSSNSPERLIQSGHGQQKRKGKTSGHLGH